MTGPEHYQEAERLIEDALSLNDEGADMSPHIAVAQVHATLALAAATALSDPDGGMPVPDWRVWMGACGTPKQTAATAGEGD